MKKLFFSMIALAGLAFAFTSCAKEAQEPNFETKAVDAAYFVKPVFETDEEGNTVSYLTELEVAANIWLPFFNYNLETNIPLENLLNEVEVVYTAEWLTAEINLYEVPVFNEDYEIIGYELAASLSFDFENNTGAARTAIVILEGANVDTWTINIEQQSGIYEVPDFNGEYTLYYYDEAFNEYENICEVVSGPYGGTITPFGEWGSLSFGVLDGEYLTLASPTGAEYEEEALWYFFYSVETNEVIFDYDFMVAIEGGNFGYNIDYNYGVAFGTITNSYDEETGEYSQTFNEVARFQYIVFL